MQLHLVKHIAKIENLNITTSFKLTIPKSKVKFDSIK